MTLPHQLYTKDDIAFKVVETLFVRADRLTNANVRSMYWGSVKALSIEAAAKVMYARGYKTKKFFKPFEEDANMAAIEYKTTLYMLLVKCFLRYFAKEVASLKRMNPMRYARLTGVGHAQIHNDLIRNFNLCIFPRIVEAFESIQAERGEFATKRERRRYFKQCMRIKLDPKISDYIWDLNYQAGVFDDSEADEELPFIVLNQLRREIMREKSIDEHLNPRPQPEPFIDNRVYEEIEWSKEEDYVEEDSDWVFVSREFDAVMVDEIFDVDMKVQSDSERESEWGSEEQSEGERTSRTYSKTESEEE